MSMQVFEQDDVEKHLLSVGKYGAWNISRPDQVEGEGWLVSGKMVGYWSSTAHVASIVHRTPGAGANNVCFLAGCYLR